MSTVILLSSSPPQVFARSPTPADSSPLPSTATLVQGHNASLKKFKTTKRQRDGFSSPFTTARHVLADKCSAKNLMIQSPRRNRFRSSQDGKEVEENICDATADVRTISSAVRPGTAGREDFTTEREHIHALENTRTDSQPHRLRSQAQEVDGPLFLEGAVARRLDWTPPKGESQPNENVHAETVVTGFSKGIIEGFAYAGQTRSNAQSPAPEIVKPAKRRRVESSNAKAAETDILSLSVPKLVKNHSGTVKPASKRNRSPAKKALTITGLATSHFAGHVESTDSPMMQYLTSTQAQSNTNATDTALETKVQQTKTAAKKLKNSKTAKSKSSLLSPRSALKTIDSQEAIFGSASQLAREDSPTFLRETIQAIKESESFMKSDPFSSPQRTQQTSMENTPKVGTVRYKRTRNLWAAAGRDEDNALLHVDVVDMTDTPAVRAAFAGKDVMVQPRVGRATSPSEAGMSLRGVRCSSPRADGSVMDIMDIETPCLVQRRSLSSVAGSTDREQPMQALQDPEQITLSKDLAPPEIKEPPPPKPNYAGFATHDLQKQIKSFGFKALRKREKMIELLDRCWEEKHGPAEITNTEPEAVPFGDFLSKVHDLSARPDPKVKKPRARKKKDESEKTPKDKPPKKPRQRKKKETELGDVQDGPKEAKPKAVRKRKSKAALDKEKSILDIDDIDDTIPEELRALGAFEDWAKPDLKPTTKPKSKPRSKPEPITKAPEPTTGSTAADPNCLPTPPATLPLTTVPPSSPGFENATPQVSEPTDLNPTPSSTPPSLSNQITAAVMHQSLPLSRPKTNPQSVSSSAKRNHNTHPTWHEKILLYDPIVLEDLALWLNTEGLNAVGEDREVSALEVREWCESRGVCCLWKGGWRGNNSGGGSGSK